MAKTNPARGTLDKQHSPGVNKAPSERYGAPEAMPNVQEWPSYSGKPDKTGDGTKQSGK